MATLEADLELNLDAALSNLSGLDEALATSAASFGESLAGAVEAASGAAGTISVEADTTPALAAVGELESDIAAAQPSVSVDADTSAAQEAVSELGSTSEDAAGGVEHLGSSSAALVGATHLATGSVGGLEHAAHGLGVGTAAAIGGAAALAGGIGELAHKAIEGLSAQQRFDTILGKFGETVEHIKVGNLDTDLDHLAISLGTVPSNAQNAAATLFQMGTNAGVAAPQVATTTAEIIALASRSVALKPSLGDVGTVAEQMGIRLARGGNFAAKLGVSLTAADINTRALANTGKQSAADLQPFEKTVAAVQLATEKYGHSLKEDVAKGADNAAIQQRRFSAELQHALETIARPLVAPLFDTMEAALPIVEALAQILVSLGTAALPIVTTAAELLAPVLQLIADGLDALGPLVSAGIAGWVAYQLAVTVVPALMAAVAGGMELLTVVAPAMGAAVETAAGEVAAASLLVEGAAAPIGLIVGALALGAAAFGLFGGGADAGSHDLDSFSSSLEKAQGKLDETTTKAGRAFFETRHQLDDLANGGVKLNAVLDATSGTSAKQRDALSELAGVTDDLVHAQKLVPIGLEESARASNGNAIAVDNLKEKQRALIDSLREENPALASVLQQLLAHHQLNPGLAASIAELAGKHAEVTDKLKERSKTEATDAEIIQQQTAVVELGASAQAAYNAALDEGKTTTEAAGAAVDAYKASLDRLVNVNLDAFSANAQFQQSMDSLLTTLAPQKGALDASSLSTGANAQALAEGARNAEAFAAAQERLTPGVGAGDKVMQGFTNSVRTLLSNLGVAPEAIDSIIQQLGLTPFAVQSAQAAFAGLPLSAEQAASGASLAFGNWGPALSAAGFGLGSGAVTGFSLGAAGLPGAVDGSASVGSLAFGNWAGAFGAAGTGLGAAAVTGVQSGAAPMPGEVGKITTQAAAAGTRHTGLMADAGKALGKAFADNLGGTAPQASDAGHTIATRGADGTRNTGGFADAGRAGGHAYADALRSTQGDARAAGQAIARAAADGASNAGSPSTHMFFDAGTKQADAYGKGLESQTKNVTDKAKKVAQAAAEGMRSVLLNDTASIFDRAASSVPSLSEQLRQVLGDIFKTGPGGVPLLNPADLTTGLQTATADLQAFYANINAIIKQGNPELAAALAALGPNDLGAKAAAQLAATQPQIAAAWQQALLPLQKLDLAQKAGLEFQSQLDQFLAKALTSPAAQKAAQEKFGKGVGQLTTAQLEALAADLAETGTEKADFVKTLQNNPVLKALVKKRFGGRGPSGLSDSELDTLAKELHTKNSAVGHAAQALLDAENAVTQVGDKAKQLVDAQALVTNSPNPLGPGGGALAMTLDVTVTGVRSASDAEAAAAPITDAVKSLLSGQAKRAVKVSVKAQTRTK